MFTSKSWVNWVFSLGLVFAMGCNGGLGGCGCGNQPLPSWDYIPVDQQIEGGGQIRVTPNGFNKLTELVPAVINDALSGICVPKGSTGSMGTFGTGAEWCRDNDGTCTPGCAVNVNVNSIDMSVPQDDTFNIRASFDASATVPVKYQVVGVGGSCEFNASVTNAVFDMDLLFGINPTNGELQLNLGQINQVQLNASIDGSGLCGGVATILDSVLSFFDSLFNSFIFQLVEPILRPLIDDLLQSFLPSPLGLNDKIDVGALVNGISPGTNATLEFRGVPGGYVALKGGGLSLGLITGVNADEDESTRTPDLDSEPALCVPPMTAPDFAAAPHNLARQPSRNTFTLLPADEFNGNPDPAAELAIGMSETTLDLLGHHVVTSGMMCMGIGTSLIPQLNLGTIGIVVPSLAELGSPDGSDPLLLVLRPTKPLDFTVGEGTDTDPSITVAIDQMDVDFYAFLFGRYVRAFTITMTMNVGINLEFTTDANGDPAILPSLTGLDTSMIDLKVSNSEFLREDKAQLEQVLPSIFDLALPLITNGLQPFTLPDFAGFTLTNLQVTKVTTSEDDFLALFATLGAVSSSPRIVDWGQRHPKLMAQVLKMAPPKQKATITQTRAVLAEVDTPPADVIRAGLAHQEGGELPQVVVDVPSKDDLGRPLEYTWSIEHGIIHPFRTPENGQLVISSPAFAIQGKRTLNIQSRVVGNMYTHDKEGVDLDVTFDSVGPRILADQAAVDGGLLSVPAHDLVSADDKLLYAVGVPGSDTPQTGFIPEIPLGQAVDVAGDAGQLRVFVRDEMGNTSSTDLDLGPIVGFHGQSSGGSGCNCDAGSDQGPSGGAMLLLLMVGALLYFRPRRVLARVREVLPFRSGLGALAFAGTVIGLATQPACSCGNSPGGDLTCEIDEDCAALCPDDTIPICFDNQCVCADDVPYGRIGQYSDLDLSSSGTAWVSGYNSSHGDLMVASTPDIGPIPSQNWEFVDGVPEGPVVLPQSDIRGGIFDPGPDVGQHTSIAVRPDDAVDVAYFDVDNTSLKFATNAGGTWVMHTVEEGSNPADPELGHISIGKYTSITVRSDDGRPGIAYLAEISDGAGNITTEVRYAAAQTANPTSSADWTVWTVDTATVTVDQTDVTPIPMGVGLFIDSARKSDETPVIVYYDRVNGDLKMAQFDAVAGTFQAPVVLDDGTRDAKNTDVGWYPSISIDMNDDIHVTYESATADDLYYMDTIDNLPQIVDDGYRIVGQTDDGLPKPEFHFVGDDSQVVMATQGPVVSYQDATNHELLLATRNSQGEWEHSTIAGAEDPFAGGYGFYANAKMDGDEVVISSWVVDQPANTVWVEIFRQMVVIQ